MRESIYVTCSVPKNGAIKIPFQTNRLHSALTASALFAALKIALRESHCSSSHLRRNNHRDSAANEVIDEDWRCPLLGAKRTSRCKGQGEANANAAADADCTVAVLYAQLSAVGVGYMTNNTFAERLDRAIERSDRPKLIEGQVIERVD